MPPSRSDDARSTAGLQGPLGVRGLNHVTIAVSDLSRSFDFYVDVLGFRARARWARGAYLSAIELWLCLSLDDVAPAGDYSYIAFTIEQDEFAGYTTRLTSAGVPRWKENGSEGDSIYFLDPDHHRLELHAGSLDSRLKSLKVASYDDLVLFD